MNGQGINPLMMQAMMGGQLPMGPQIPTPTQPRPAAGTTSTTMNAPQMPQGGQTGIASMLKNPLQLAMMGGMAGKSGMGGSLMAPGSFLDTTINGPLFNPGSVGQANQMMGLTSAGNQMPTINGGTAGLNWPGMSGPGGVGQGFGSGGDGLLNSMWGGSGGSNLGLETFGSGGVGGGLGGFGGAGMGGLDAFGSGGMGMWGGSGLMDAGLMGGGGALAGGGAAEGIGATIAANPELLALAFA